MKVAKVLALAAVTALVASSSAFAGGAVWFVATGQNPNSLVKVDGQGAAGQATDLECVVPTGGRCEWLVEVLFQLDAPGGSAGWSLDIGTIDPADIGKFNIKEINVIQDGTLATNAGFGALNVPGNPGAAGAVVLIQNAFGVNANPGAVVPGQYLLMTFLLSKNKLPGEFQTSEIFLGIGSTGFTDAVNTSFGPNPSASFNYGYYTFPGYNPGYPYGALPLPVITIMNTPEPATAVAMIAGGLLLLRRRRKLAA